METALSANRRRSRWCQAARSRRLLRRPTVQPPIPHLGSLFVVGRRPPPKLKPPHRPASGHQANGHQANGHHYRTKTLMRTGRSKCTNTLTFGRPRNYRSFATRTKTEMDCCRQPNGAATNVDEKRQKSGQHSSRASVT